MSSYSVAPPVICTELICTAALQVETDDTNFRHFHKVEVTEIARGFVYPTGKSRN